MDALFCSAIITQKVLKFDYHGGRRTVEPFRYGQLRSGEKVLLGFQTAGFSDSGRIPGWRTFIAKDIADVEITDRHFLGYRHGYLPHDTSMEKVFCEVGDSLPAADAP